MADAVVRGEPVSAQARTGVPIVQRQEAGEKPREQPTQFPAQEQPKEGQAKDDDNKEKLKTGGLKVAEQLGKYLLDQFSSSPQGKQILAANERDWKPILKFFEDFADTLAGKIVLGAAATGAATGLGAAAWTSRDEPSADPGTSPSTAGPVARAPKDEKFFGLELNWDFVSPPSGMTLKTPWLDSPKIPLGTQPPAATSVLPPPPVLFKMVPKIPRVCTPSDPQGDQGEADARSAFIFWWLKHNQELAEKRQQELVNQTQLHAPPKYAPSVLKPMFKAEAEVVSDPEAIETGLRSPGQLLDSETRHFMESRFGHDFSGVRIHSGGAAEQSTKKMKASAFALGEDIVFGAGRFAPGTREGQRLLAHELTHVVQQSASKETPRTAANSRPVARLLGSSGTPFGESGVRIHAGSEAAKSAQAMRARAYTYGQDIVFNRGEFDPLSAPGRALLAHELAHTARQTSPSRYRLAFQKQPVAPPKFYQEVEDAVINLQGRVGAVDDLGYVRDLLALSKAVEAQNQAEVKRLTEKVLATSPVSAEPVARSEEYVRELVARTFLMGLEAEANKLRAFFHRLAAVPSRREPTDTKYGPDKNIWQELTRLTIERAKFGNATEASNSVDALLETFRTICREAKRIDFEEVKKDRKLNYSAGAYYNSDTLDSYFSSLIGRLRELTVPIFHGVQAMMEAAIADLESDKGTDALKATKSVIDTKIVTAYNQTIGDENLLDITVDATRSTFGEKEGKHLDYFDTSKAGEKRSVTINYFDKNQTSGFNEKTNPVGYIILARKKQVTFLEQLYVSANRAAMGATPLKLESVDDWRNFLHGKLLELQAAGKSNEEAFLTMVKFLSDYLETFTTSTPFNIEDVIKQDSENYNKRQLPRAITGQLIEDCGVYALRTVYMLSLVKFDLKLRIRFIYLPVHVGVIVTGDGLPTLIAHNNKIYPIDAATLAKERKSWDAKDPTKPGGDEQFIGEVAGSYFSPGVDLPFRLEEAPTIAKNDPQEKEKLQKYYEGTLKKDVLADAPKAGISQFHLEYLRLNDETKKAFNSVIVPAWNQAARAVWNKHRDKLFAELAKARAGQKDDYEAAAKAYLTDLDDAFKPVETALTELDQSRQGVSSTLGANPELTGTTATRGYGSRVSYSFFWQEKLAAHKTAVADRSNLKDPSKPDAITPPFSDQKGFLQPIY